MKKEQRQFLLIFFVLVLIVLASCKSTPSSDSARVGGKPPAKYIGTWQTTKNLIVGSSAITLTIDSAGKVSYISKTDATQFIDEFRASRKEKGKIYPEPDTWEATELNPIKTYDISTSGLSKSPKIQFSPSRPFVITIEDLTDFDTLEKNSSINIVVSDDEKTLTMTISDEPEKIVLTKK